MRKIFIFLIFTLLFLPLSKAEDDFLQGSVRFNEVTEEIYLEDPMSFKYDTGYREIKKISGKEEILKTKNDDYGTIFKKNNVSLESTYKKGKSNNLTDTLENKQMIRYNNGKLILSAGINNSYEYTNLTKNSKKLFFSPQYRVNEHVILGLNNSFNTTSMTFEQGANVRYKPYFLKNTFLGLNGSIKQREDNTFTRKLEFNSEFYLW